MLVTLLPIIYCVTCEPKIFLILEEYEYVFPTMYCELMATEVKPLQPEKAQFPMLVTLLPIVTEVKPLQLRKVSFPMLVTLLGIITEVKPLQPSKAEYPMLVTLLGISIEVKPLQL